jgi:hypothetical protein
MHQDYLELLRSLEKSKVRYLIIGGYAVIQYTEPRYTKDLDIWIEASPSNARNVLRALTIFGAPVDNLTEQELAKPGLVYIFGVPPLRVDLMNQAPGCSFATAWKSRERVSIGKSTFSFVGKQSLIRLKKAAGRPQDKADLVKLQQKLRPK